MFGLLAGYRKRRAVARYARELPRRLVKDYGASETYTRAQIERAAAALDLDRRFIVYAFAVFLGAEAFAALSPELRQGLSFDEARAEFLRLVPALQGSFESLTDNKVTMSWPYGSPGPGDGGF